MRVGVFYKAALVQYHAAGIDETLLEISDLSRGEIRRLLDGYASLSAP